MLVCPAFWVQKKFTHVIRVSHELLYTGVIYPVRHRYKIGDETWNLTFEEGRIAEDDIGIVNSCSVFLCHH